MAGEREVWAQAEKPRQAQANSRNKVIPEESRVKPEVTAMSLKSWFTLSASEGGEKEMCSKCKQIKLQMITYGDIVSQLKLLKYDTQLLSVVDCVEATVPWLKSL